jgi:AsmA protein
LKLSVFPWIALEFGPASLGNPPGFGNEPFAAVRHVAVRVKLLPLLRKRLQMGRVEIDGLDLRLQRNAQGEGNWQGFGGRGTRVEPAESGTEALQEVSGVVVNDSRLSYQDTVADQVNLTIGHVASGAPVPFTLQVKLVMSRGSQPIRITGHGDFVYGGNALRATGLVVQLDDSTLRGAAAVTSLDTNAMSFDLVLDHINVDRYLAAMRPSAGKAAPPSEAKSGEPPGGVLKNLQMDGKLAIGSATIAGVTATQVRANVAAKDGVTHISPATAKLYGGDYSGDITLDERGSTPALRLDQRFTGVDVASFLKDFAKLQRVSGSANVTAELAAHGLASEEFIKSLSGRVNAYVTNGAIEGIDLWFEINRAIALLQKQALPAGKSSGRTRFDVFKASAVLSDGIASTKDLTIASQNLRVSGAGTANLVNEAINCQIKATVLKEAPAATAAAEATLAEVPLTITGTLKSPEVRPDLEAMARARVQEELGKHKEELQQKLQDALKGLFK